AAAARRRGWRPTGERPPAVCRGRGRRPPSVRDVPSVTAATGSMPPTHPSVRQNLGTTWNDPEVITVL
ncbi:MAG: hypothetical protein ACP5MJ_16060, partial [Roseiflexus sp.]